MNPKKAKKVVKKTKGELNDKDLKGVAGGAGSENRYVGADSGQPDSGQTGLGETGSDPTRIPPVSEDPDRIPQ